MTSIDSRHVPNTDGSHNIPLSPLKSRRDVVSVKETVRLLRVSFDAIRNGNNVVPNQENIISELMTTIINHAEKQMKPGINDSPFRLHNITLEYGREGLCELLINIFRDNNVCTCVCNSTNLVLTTASRLMILLCTNCNENKAKFRQASLVEYFEQLIKLLNASDRIGNKSTVDICSNALFTLLPKSQPRVKEGPEEESIAPLYRLHDGTYHVGTPQESIASPSYLHERYNRIKNAIQTPSTSTRMGTEHSLLLSNDLISPIGATGASTSKLLIRPLPSRGAIQFAKLTQQTSSTSSFLSMIPFEVSDSAVMTSDTSNSDNVKSLNQRINDITSIEQIIQGITLVESKPFPTNIQLATNLFHRLSKLVLLNPVIGEQMRQQSLLPRITKLGKQFVDVADCTVRTCQLMSNLSLNDFAAHDLGKCGGCELLGSILLRYSRSSKVISIYCCNAVYNISYKNENNKIKLRNTCVAEAIVAVLRSHTRKFEAEEWACKAAIAVCYGCDDNRKEFGLHGGCELVVKIIERCLNFDTSSSDAGMFVSKLKGKKKEEEEKIMEERRVEDIKYAHGKLDILLNLIQTAMLCLKTISHASVNNAVALTTANAIEVVLITLRFFHGIHTRSNRNILGNFYYKSVLCTLPSCLLGANAESITKPFVHDIVLSCVHTLRYMLSHDAHTLRVARKQIMALDGGDLLVHVLSCTTYRSQHSIILFTLWSLANLCAIPRRLKKIKFKEDRALKEDLMLGQVQHNDNSKSIDDDDSVGSSSVGSSTIGGGSTTASFLNIRAILGDLDICSVLHKLLITQTLKLKNILQTRKDVDHLRMCLDIIRRGVITLHCLVQKCRINKKRLHELQVSTTLEMLSDMCYLNGYNPNVIVQSYNPMLPAKEMLKLIKKTTRRIKYVWREEDGLEYGDDDLSQTD